MNYALGAQWNLSDSQLFFNDGVFHAARNNLKKYFCYLFRFSLKMTRINDFRQSYKMLQEHISGLKSPESILIDIHLIDIINIE